MEYVTTLVNREYKLHQLVLRLGSPTKSWRSLENPKTQFHKKLNFKLDFELSHVALARLRVNIFLYQAPLATLGQSHNILEIQPSNLDGGQKN